MPPVVQTLRASATVPDLLYRVERPVVDALNESRHLCSLYSRWQLTERAIETLAEYGVACSDCANRQHSHPASKTIEEYIKQVILPHLLAGRDTTIYWSKPGKAADIAERCGLRNWHLFNRQVTAKDLIRYPDASADALPPCPTPICYVDDAAHYLDPDDVAALFFSEGSQLREAFCTVIIPPELLVSHLGPVTPDLYTFERRGDFFEFYPDGNVAEGYEQPHSCIWWLKTKCINVPGRGQIHLTRLNSIGAHHIFHLNVSVPNHRAERHFKMGELIRIPDCFPGFNTGKEVDRLIYRRWFSVAYSYGAAVTSVKRHQIATRIRQVLLRDDRVVSERDLNTCAALAQFMHDHRDKLSADFRPRWRLRHIITRSALVMRVRRALNFSSRHILDAAREVLSAPFWTAPQHLWGINAQPFSSHFFGLAVPPPPPPKPGLPFWRKRKSCPSSPSHRSLRQTPSPDVGEPADGEPRLKASPPPKERESPCLHEPSAPPLPSHLLLRAAEGPAAVDPSQTPERVNASLSHDKVHPLVDAFLERSQRGDTDLAGGVDDAESEVWFSASDSVDSEPPRSAEELECCGTAEAPPTDTWAYHGFHGRCCYGPEFTTPDPCPMCCEPPPAYRRCWQYSPHKPCLVSAVADASGFSKDHVLNTLLFNNPTAFHNLLNSPVLGRPEILTLALRLRICIRIFQGEFEDRIGPIGWPNVILNLADCHFSAGLPRPPGLTTGQPLTPPTTSGTSIRGTPSLSGPLEPPADTMAIPRPGRYAARRKRAKALVFAIMSGEYGTDVLQKDPNLRAWWEDVRAPGPHVPTTSVTASWGCPGAGKSTTILGLLRAKLASGDLNFMVVAPTNSLRDEWKEKLPEAASRNLIRTPEFALKEAYANFVVIDDAGKFPPGFVDFLLYRNPSIRRIHATFDPAQSVYFCPRHDSKLNALPPEVDTYRPFAGEYLLVSRRLSRGVAAALGLRTASDRDGRIMFSPVPPSGSPILVASQHTQAMFGDVAPTFTFNGSVGLNFDGDCTVYVDESALLCDDRAVYTALTRCKGSVHVCLSDRILMHRRQRAKSAILERLLTQRGLQSAVAAHIRKRTGILLGGAPNLYDVLAQVPSLTPILDDVPTPKTPKVDFVSLTLPELLYPAPSLRAVHRSVSNDSLDQACENLVGLPPLAEARERWFGKAHTSQVVEDPLGKGIFLKHSAKDAVTTAWSLRERIARPGRTSLANRKDLGMAMFLAFLKTTQLPTEPWNEGDYEAAFREDQDRYLSKGLKTLGAIAERNDPLWSRDFIHLFLKSQSITKPGTQMAPAKKGQIIMCLCTLASVRFGPLAKFIAEKVGRLLPPNVFFLNGQTPADLGQFCRDRFDFRHFSMEGDFTAYDQSQKEEFLIFDALLFRHFNVPEILVREYLEHMTSLWTFLGKLGAMMPTGHKMTLVMNSMRTLGYLCLRFLVRPGTPMCVSGDDSVIAGPVKEGPLWRHLGPRFFLDLKEERSRYPTFCGWRMTPAGVFKDPDILAARVIYQAYRGNLAACFRNYAAEVRPAMDMGDLLPEFCSEAQLEKYAFVVESLTAFAEELGLPLAGFSDESGKARADRPYDLSAPAVGAFL